MAEPIVVSPRTGPTAALARPAPLLPTPSGASSRFPSPLLQGEIGHHPFSPLGTRNPCVSFPVKGLPSPKVTQKSMVCLQPVTASTGRACVCVCACVHVDVCVQVCACMLNARTSKVTPSSQEDLSSNPGYATNSLSNLEQVP